VKSFVAEDTVVLPGALATKFAAEPSVPNVWLLVRSRMPLEALVGTVKRR